MYGTGGAYAFLVGVVVKTAGAGVNRSDKHKRSGEIHGQACPGDGYLFFLIGLSEYLEDCPFELWEFVEKQYAVVGKRNFSGQRIGSAAYQGHIADGMVGCPERSVGH